MRAVLVFCEGRHDVVFTQRSLGALGDCSWVRKPVVYQSALAIQSSGSNLAEFSLGPPRPWPSRGTARLASLSSGSATGASRNRLRLLASS